MRKKEKLTWEQQYDYMLANREKENEKQVKEFIKKNADKMKAIYKTDKISDIIKALRKSKNQR